jgi:myosin heavy subunit
MRTIFHFTKFEAVIRAFLEVRRYKRVREKIILVQSVLRKFTQRNIFKCTLKGFVRCQANIRRFVARRKYLFRYARAAQSLVRAYLTRRRFASRMQHTLLLNAIFVNIDCLRSFGRHCPTFVLACATSAYAM